jgi:NitT/TauT family transport system substrate-binding protein
MNAPARLIRIGLAAMLAAGLLSGCAAKPAAEPAATPEKPAAEAAAPSAIRIGTLATEDSLPLWVAEERGYFAVEKLPKVEITVFQSAQERDVAFASGAIDAFMGDLIAAANLEAAKVDVSVPMVMLGADQSQGRFGVVVPKGSKVTDIAQLKGVPVGTSSATIQEYVLDKLMAEAGVADAEVKKEEVKKVPVRFELLMAGKLKAAALPEPFLTLAEQGGATVVGDDTKAKENVSQTVLGVSTKFTSTPEGAASVAAVLKAWDAAVSEINADPAAYRQTLVDKARLPKPLATTYAVNTYPTAAPPTEPQVQAVLDWMKAKGYLKADIKYTDLVPPAM